MPAIVSVFSFLLLLLIGRSIGFAWREAILAAAVVWGLVLTIITETLSFLEAFSFLAVLSSWILMAMVLTILYSRFRNGAGISRETVSSIAPPPFSLLLPIGFIVALTGLIAVVAPPNNYDSMTYHLSRVAHWIQNHDVQPYPSNIDRQLFMPPWAEFAIAHFQILSGDDRLANSVQWLSMTGSLVGVSLIARQLGGDRNTQWLAALIAVCLPMGILQGSSTQSDYVVSFWLVCFAYYVMSLVSMKQPIIRPLGILAGISLGLALLTKPTAYLFALPFIVWLTIDMVRKMGAKSLTPALAILAIAFIINAGHYLRNWEVFNSPIAPASTSEGSSLTNLSVINDGEFEAVIWRFASNLIRNPASQMAVPFYYGNRIVEVAVEKIERLLALRGNVRSFRIEPRQNHEDYAGNPFHLLLIGFSGAVIIGQLKRVSPSMIHWYVASLLGGYLIFCLYINWNVWITRLQLPLLVLWSAPIAIALSGLALARARLYSVVFLVIASQYWLFCNETRPLIGKGNIFSMPRWEQYFRNSRPSFTAQYTHAASLLRDRGCAQVGLWLGYDSWEYPLWILLKRDDLRIEHIRVGNESARVSLRGDEKSFVPCALVVMESNAAPDQIVEGGRAYVKNWMGDKVAVYELETQPL